jgi:Na+-transporting methylmalonyl-CoA/oxaloacetate decarboxylase gamma subunit
MPEAAPTTPTTFLSRILNHKWMIAILSAGVLAALAVLFVLIVVIWGFGVIQSEAKLRNLVMAKQQANTTDFDNMWKTQMKTAQIPAQQQAMLKNVVVEYANARSGGGKGGSLATLVHEAIPNVDVSIFNHILRIVESTGESWAQRQKELIDLNRAHTDIVTVPPSSFVCSLFGKTVIDIKLVTSSKTDKAFETGKDDDVNLFPAPAPTAPATPAPAK